MYCFKNEHVQFQVPDESIYGNIRGLKTTGTIVEVRKNHVIIEINPEWKITIKNSWIIPPRRQI